MLLHRHGHAHGAELPPGTTAAGFMGGFLLATALLHGAGIAIGLMRGLPRGAFVLRGGGAMISLAGAWLLAGVL